MSSNVDNCLIQLKNKKKTFTVKSDSPTYEYLYILRDKNYVRFNEKQDSEDSNKINIYDFKLTGVGRDRLDELGALPWYHKPSSVQNLILVVTIFAIIVAALIG